MAGGDYDSIDDAVRDALHGWRLHREAGTASLEETRRLVRAGMEGSPGIGADLVFAQLRVRYAVPGPA